MLNQRENLIRGAFSFLAAAVTLGMAQEWFAWAYAQRSFWKLVPGVVLTTFAVYEAHKVWTRTEHAMGLVAYE